MESKLTQKMLRQRAAFRMIVLTLSVALGVLSGMLNQYYPFASGILMGISGSAFVWSTVEMVDFYAEVHLAYTKERVVFLMAVEQSYSEMTNIIKEGISKEKINWGIFRKKVHELYNYTAHVPFSERVYATSKEFEKLANYIIRMSWKVDACFYNKTDEDVVADAEIYKNLRETFIADECEQIDATQVRKGLTWIQDIEEINKKISEIELSYEPFREGNELIDCSDEGDIAESFSISSDCPNYKKEVTTFIPRKLLRVDFLKKKQRGAFVTVTKILIRKLQEF